MAIKQQTVGLLKHIVRRFNFSIPVTRNHTRFRIPLIRQMGTQNIRGTEPWMTELLSTLLPDLRDEIFVDIGANLGQTLLKFKSVSTSVDYYGFEPNPACCYYLEQLIAENHFDKTVVFPVAIAEEIGVASLYIHHTDDTAGSSASLLKDFKNEVVSFQKMIPVFNLTYFRERYFEDKPVGILKIDVEGAELEALKGSQETIVRDQPIIICELLPPINKIVRSETLEKKRQIQQLLEGLGYHLCKVTKKTTGSIAGIRKLSDLASETVNSKGWDYLFIPDGKMSYIQGKLSLITG